MRCYGMTTGSVLIVSYLPIWDMGTGGTAARHRTVVGLAKRGFEVVYLHLRFPVLERRPQACTEDRPGSTLYEVVSLDLCPRWFGELSVLFKAPGLGALARRMAGGIKIGLGEAAVRRFIERSGVPDLLYGAGSDSVLSTAPIARELGIPMVARFYGTFLGDLLSPLPLKRLFIKAKHYGEVTAFRNRADLCIICNDGTNGDKVAAALGVATDRVRFWMDGVDDDYPRLSEGAISTIRSELGVPPDGVLGILASRLAGWKRVDRVIQGIADLPCPLRAKLRVLILGHGPRRAQLEKMARRRRVDGVVLFKGPVPFESVFTYMQAADFFVSLQDVTNFGNNTLQALRVGLPMVLLDAGQTKAILGPSNVGPIVEKTDGRSGVCAAIHTLISSPDARAVWRANSLRLAPALLSTWDERIDLEARELSTLLADSRLESPY